MIQKLSLKDVGPAPALEFDFAPRLNLLTGDNGLGKTFILDVLWWVLTTTWAGEKAFPTRPVPESGSPEKVELKPEISVALRGLPGTPDIQNRSHWRWGTQEWVGGDTETERPSSLVIYARIDGSYAVWDALYAPGNLSSFADAAIVLTPSELWDGKEELADPRGPAGKRTIIGGLIADWVGWQQRAKSPEFEALRLVLLALSPPDEALIPGEPTRVHLRDRRDIPTLATSYGLVPVTLASAGMRRALSLAYLLVWAWTEHRKAAERSQQPATREVVLLIDEPELHQHPAWQRVFLPAVLRALSLIAPEAATQIFIATHSPFVFASIESLFREEVDDLFVLERDGRVVRVAELPFCKEGEVGSWLGSRVFGHLQGRSREAELAIQAATDFMAHREGQAEQRLASLAERLKELPQRADRGEADPSALIRKEDYKNLPLVERVHVALQNTLPGHDEFWVHWTLVYRPGRRGDPA